MWTRRREGGKEGREGRKGGEGGRKKGERITPALVKRIMPLFTEWIDFIILMYESPVGGTKSTVTPTSISMVPSPFQAVSLGVENSYIKKEKYKLP